MNEGRIYKIFVCLTCCIYNLNNYVNLAFSDFRNFKIENNGSRSKENMCGLLRGHHWR